MVRRNQHIVAALHLLVSMNDRSHSNKKTNTESTNSAMPELVASGKIIKHMETTHLARAIRFFRIHDAYVLSCLCFIVFLFYHAQYPVCDYFEQRMSM